MDMHTHELSQRERERDQATQREGVGEMDECKYICNWNGFLLSSNKGAGWELNWEKEKKMRENKDIYGRQVLRVSISTYI